jgi:hypothetical protein
MIRKAALQKQTVVKEGIVESYRSKTVKDYELTPNQSGKI